MSRFGRTLFLVLLVGSCIGCDRLTKQIAVEHLQPVQHEGPRSYLGDTVRIQYAENAGAFLGLGGSWPPAVRFWLLVVVTGALLAFVVVHLVRNAHVGPARTAALGLVLAGGLGNLWDRLRDEYVVDFMNLGIGPVRTGIFNVADVAITAGVIALLVLGLTPPEHEEAGQPAETPPQPGEG